MIVKLRLYHFDLQLRHPFTISRETITTQPTLIVELQMDGVSGYGEATANPYYGRDIDGMLRLLKQNQSKIETANWEHPAELWETLEQDLRIDTFAQCALDQAAYDLWGKREQKSVFRLLGWQEDAPRPESNYTLGIDTPAKIAEKLAEFPDWPVYKIKLGRGNDIATLRHLKELTSARLRVDANGGWSLAEAAAIAPRLPEYNVELIEQPLHANDIHALPKLKESTNLPLIADESCLVPADVKQCADAGFDGINIKLVKCGGMTPALEMMTEARKLKLKVMMGCMTESTVGISAIAQLLPGLDFVDMDGATLLAEDIAQGVQLKQGQCSYPELIMGNGVHGLRTDLAIQGTTSA